MTLQRLVLTYTREGVEIRCLYRSKAQPHPGTAARRREATELARAGLREALRALDAGDATDLGTSGFTTREDVLGLSAASRDGVKSHERMKEGHVAATSSARPGPAPATERTR